jgi:hypothetical protein
LKGYRWWRGRGPELSNRAATWLTIAYLVFFPFDVWVVSRMVDAPQPMLYAGLLATVHLVLFAIIVRLYSASTTRDFLFLTLMAFASMLVSAILTVDTAFIVFFFVFLVLAVSTFVALEMWRSARSGVTQPVASGTRAARRLHRALGVSSAAIAFGSLAIGALIFLLLPRFSGGYMSGFNLQPTLMSGFSDDAELGQIGEIKKSSTVVMRIRVDGGRDAARGVHWRGVALTKFDGKRWYNEPQQPMILTPASEGWFHLNSGEINRARGGKRIHYTVLLEPIASTAIFLVNDAESLRGGFNGEAGASPWGQRRSFLLEDSTGSIFNPNHNFTRMQYEARSVLPVPPAGAMHQAGFDYSPSIREMYLQLPKLDQRIPELAKQITAHAETPYDKARAIEGYLPSHYGYTLDLTGPPPSDPLPYFLFQKRAGHCEYFAAAMTVMLRSVGVPARYINGFQTGEYNDIGGDFVVRASDAHSWVEAYFPSNGWIAFDPTPASEEKSPGMFAWLAHYWDWLDLQWSEWVINYDFVHQITVAQNLQSTSRYWTERLTKAFADARRLATDRLELWQSRAVDSRAALPLGIAILGVLCISAILLQPKVRQWLVAVWCLRVAPSARMTPHLATLQYNEMLRLLARRGIRKGPAQTPLEFATSLPDEKLAATVSELTAMYHSARFGGQVHDPRQVSSLLDRIQGFVRPR